MCGYLRVIAFIFFALIANMRKTNSIANTFEIDAYLRKRISSLGKFWPVFQNSLSINKNITQFHKKQSVSNTSQSQIFRIRLIQNKS